MPPRIALVVLAVLGALAPIPSASAQHVHTSRQGAKLLPLPKEKGVWHFAVFGDRTGGPAEGIKVLAQAVKDTNLLDPDLVMTVGDLIQGYNTTEPWMKQMREYQKVMSDLRMPWYPVAGNHDVYWRGPDRPFGQHEGNYERHFGPLWYCFEHKTAGFVALYSDEGDLKTGDKGFRRKRHTQMSPEQLAWLEKALASLKDKKHVFVFLHHPRWQSGRYPGTNWDEVHNRLVRAGNVTAVFGGHIHRMTYDGLKDGIEYLTLATVGGGLPGIMPEAGWLHHVNIVTVRDEGIQMATLPVGGVIDPRTFDAERLEDVDLLMRAGRPELRRTVEVAENGAADGEVLIELKNPARHPVEATVIVEGDPTWSLDPGHLHARIAPGGTSRLRFHVAREARGLAGLVAPTIRTQLDLLHPQVRISIPERKTALRTDVQVPERDEQTPAGVLELDGKSCLMVPASEIKVPQGPITLEGWIRARSYKGRRPFLAKTEGSEFGIFCNNGQPEFSVHLNGRYASVKPDKPVLEVNRWHHVAGVFDGVEVRLYVDGKLVARKDARGRRTLNDHPFYVGADTNRNGKAVDHLHGWIDAVRISRVARYKQTFEPKRHFERDPFTMLWLPLDTHYGRIHPDRSGRKAHATPQGQAAIVPFARRGRVSR